MHHISDDYVWHFYDGPLGTIYLPVILYTDKGFDFFSSSNFYDENHELVPYKEFKIEEGSIISESTKIKFDFSIKKNVATLFLCSILLLLMGFSVARSYRKRAGKAPKGLQSFIEPIVVFIRDEVAIPAIGEKKYERYMPYLLTLFFFVWISNLMGLTPGAANLTGNIAVTAMLAITTFIITMFSTKKHFWGHIFNPDGVPLWLYPIIVPIEIVGIFVKPFSLMIRLFANITAGHVILLSMFSLIFIFQSYFVGVLSVAFAVFLNGIEILVAAIQAYIFAMLSAMYFGEASHEVEHH